MNANNVLIFEGEQTNFNRFITLKKIFKINPFLKIIIFILFIIICILLLKLKKNSDYIIELLLKNNFLNKKLITQFDFIEVKLQILEENQKILSNKEKIMTNNNNNLHYLLSSMEVVGYNKIRIGRKADGGYIFLNDFTNIKIAYSFGINTEISFEKELADKKIDIYMYDHSINELPFENSKFHWKKLGLCGAKSADQNMRTLYELLKENGHLEEDNMILKIDIESYEWEVFQYLPFNIFRQFKYIVVEFHFNDSEIEYYNILKRIQITHRIFHVHCNNCGEIINLNGIKICQALEISFIQKNGYKFIKDNNIYPIEGLDYKNCQDNEDLNYIINLFNKYTNN